MDEGFFAQLKFELGQLRFAVKKTEVPSVFWLLKVFELSKTWVYLLILHRLFLQHMEERQIELEALEKAIQEGIGLLIIKKEIVWEFAKDIISSFLVPIS